MHMNAHFLDLKYMHIQAKRMYEICLYKCQIDDDVEGKTNMNSLEGKRIKGSRRSSVDAINFVKNEQAAAKEDKMIGNVKAMLAGDPSIPDTLSTPAEDAAKAADKERKDKVSKT